MEALLGRTYVSAKEWKTSKINPIQHMIQSLNIKFDLSSYNRLQSELQILKKQVCTMQDVAEQLVAQNSSLARDHDRESEDEFQKLSTQHLISHMDRTGSSLLTTGGPGPMATAPQLPVLALKPDFLSFSMSITDMRIGKEAYRSYNRASEFDHYPFVKHKAFLFCCLDNKVV